MLSIIKWASDEVERQGRPATSVYDMMCAWVFAKALYDQGNLLPTEDDLKVIAWLIEPNCNEAYRTTAVAFLNGGIAASAQNVPRGVALICKHLDEETDPTSFCVALLNIHPWEDGNGRTTAIVWNWLNGTLGEPTIMPDWYNVHEEVTAHVNN